WGGFNCRVFCQNKAPDERCDTKLVSQLETGLVSYGKPLPPRNEMQGSRPIGQKVFPVSQVFDQHNTAAWFQGATHLAEKLQLRFLPPQFVRDEKKENGVALAVL